MTVKTRLSKNKSNIYINYLTELLDVTTPQVWMFILHLLNTKFMKDVSRDNV